MQVNGYTDNSPAFGMHYSKKTITSLKRIVPELIKNEGFENARMAVANLTRLGKRQDGLITELVSDGHPYSIEVGVKPLKNGAFSHFVYPNTPSCTHFLSTNHSPFRAFTESLATDKFVNVSHTEIDYHTNRIKNQTLEDKVKQRVWQTKEALIDAGEWIQDKFSVIDGATLPNGKKVRSTLVIIDDMKNAFHGFWNRVNEPYNHDVDFLRREIDKLPTV